MDVIIAILKSTHIACPEVARFLKNSFMFENWKHNNRKTKIPRWLGRENGKNVARTRNCCGLPSSPGPTLLSKSWLRYPQLYLKCFCDEPVLIFYGGRLNLLCWESGGIWGGPIRSPGWRGTGLFRHSSSFGGRVRGRGGGRRNFFPLDILYFY